MPDAVQPGEDKKRIEESNDWLNEYGGEPSEEYLQRLADANTPEAGEILAGLAEQYDIPYDEDMDAHVLIQQIRQKMEEGEGDYNQSALS